jgi:hypothetical protein
MEKKSKATVGDTVFVQFKYCKKEKPFCKRTVTQVIETEEGFEYAFDKLVCVTTSEYIGDEIKTYSTSPAQEEMIYLEGEILNVFDDNFRGKKMSLDFVDYDE